MLIYNPAERLSAKRALTSPYFVRTSEIESY